jgi:hypothetical protein
LIWDAEDPLAVFKNYPWTRHGLKEHPLGYRFPNANYEGEEFVGFDIRATHCTGYSDDGDPCSQCRSLKKKVYHLRQMSKQPPGRLNHQYHTHEQLTQGHHSKSKIIKDLQLSVRWFHLLLLSKLTHDHQNINLSRNNRVAKKRLKIDDRFMSAILSNQSSRVDQLIRVYTNQGASRSAITKAIHDASAGLLKV